MPAVTRTTPLTKTEWGACLMLGSTSLLISALLKCTPAAWAERFKLPVDERRVVADNMLVKLSEKVQNTTVGGGAGKDDDFKETGAQEELATAKQNLQ